MAVSLVAADTYCNVPGLGLFERPGNSPLSLAAMRSRHLAALGVAVAALLTACGGGGGDPSATETVTATTTVTATPKTFESAAAETTGTADEDPYAPNVGDRALRVGETRVGQDVRTTLHEVMIPYPPGQYREPEPGNVFLGLRVEQCLDDDAPADVYSTSLIDWSAVTPTGNEFKTGGSSWTDWPTPRFPDYVTMVPGRCVKGWLAFEVPAGTKVASLIWRPDGTTTAEWLPR